MLFFPINQSSNWLQVVIPLNKFSTKQLLGNVIQLFLLVGEQQRLDAGGEDVVLEAELPTGLVDLRVPVQLVALLADAIQFYKLGNVVFSKAAKQREASRFAVYYKSCHKQQETDEKCTPSGNRFIPERGRERERER